MSEVEGCVLAGYFLGTLNLLKYWNRFIMEIKSEIYYNYLAIPFFNVFLHKPHQPAQMVNVKLFKGSVLFCDMGLKMFSVL